ncbi:MAG: hypothetical protein IKF78_00625 [Atopobiaceae bacterium]|nr:hypothetical protein [Atopobiaceae bacterium]
MTPEQMEKRIAELEERLALFESKTGFMSADTMLENAKAWIARNPMAWDLIKARAQVSIRQQKRFSVKRALEELRDAPGIVWGSNDDFKISNSYASVFVRILVQEMPELREFVTLRRSKVDRLFNVA